MSESALIQFTADAQAQAEQLATQAENHGKPLRVYLDGKGCDGFYYGVAFDELLEADFSWSLGSLTVVVDKDSMQFLEGAEVTWVDDERGRGFLVENPDHRRFRGKFYKRQVWQDRLLAGKKDAQSPGATDPKDEAKI